MRPSSTDWRIAWASRSSRALDKPTLSGLATGSWSAPTVTTAKPNITSAIGRMLMATENTAREERCRTVDLVAL